MRRFQGCQVLELTIRNGERSVVVRESCYWKINVLQVAPRQSTLVYMRTVLGSLQRSYVLDDGTAVWLKVSDHVLVWR